MKKLLLITALLLAPTLANAEEIKAKVNGMVCAYCAQGIEKALQKQPGVEHVKVDLDNNIVVIHTKAVGDVSDDIIKSTVTDAGFTVTEIERS